ncbi:MAG: c-type cytochrome [Micropepsaceae bacterium]
MIRAPLAFSAALILSSAPALAADAVRGEQRFKSVCATCRSLDPAQKKLGPHLKGVVGRKSASVEAANYSASLKAANIVWNETALDEFLADPKKKVPGAAKLVKFGNAQDRADIIAYLATVK